MSSLTREILERLYLVENLSQREIAEELDFTQPGVSQAMDRFGIDARSTSLSTSMAKSGPTPRLDNHGYEYIQNSVLGETVQFRLHRLVAMAEYGIERVADGVVHHKNNIPWDNRPKNLEVLEDTEHRSLHARKRSRSSGGQFA